MMRSIAAASAALVYAALSIAPAAAADKVVLMLNWYVYGEHAPFYYGKAKGIYAAEGIDLEIQEGRGSAATTQAVAAKTADFGYVDVPTMFAALVILALIGVVLFWIVDRIERLVVPWHVSQREDIIFAA